jgi:alkyl sulfatase BDS1-like metallo-beta-lactamase superfamily hydrolase
MGWYDANPANLNPLPPEPAAKRYVEAMGGAKSVLAQAGKAQAAGELRWAATLLNHLVFSDEANQAARERLAAVYTELGFESEAGTWRNIYLTGAQELREGVAKLPPGAMSLDVLAATTTSMLLDFAAVRVNPKKAAERAFKLNIELTDRDERHLITIENGVLVHEAAISDPRAGATVRLKRPNLLLTLLAGAPAAPQIASGEIAITGDAALYEALTAVIEPIAANFPVVTP